ncbi:unnamed protein product [Haemonchus placei]|uniref:Uncharacterized protein n=1 Tax=Haemonchus placei TaxID=6290 RepID=A0A3P7ZPW4_HAEPC|nr:unnamed protein product [Haemonchus placei]
MTRLHTFTIIAATSHDLCILHWSQRSSIAIDDNEVVDAVFSTKELLALIVSLSGEGDRSEQ